MLKTSRRLRRHSPDETAETVDDLGEDFRMLRVKKGDPITAYKMVRA